eukprot:2256107-Pleurochrysis_carterae.AAC.1
MGTDGEAGFNSDDETRRASAASQLSMISDAIYSTRANLDHNQEQDQGALDACRDEKRLRPPSSCSVEGGLHGRLRTGAARVRTGASLHLMSRETTEEVVTRCT